MEIQGRSQFFIGCDFVHKYSEVQPSKQLYLCSLAHCEDGWVNELSGVQSAGIWCTQSVGLKFAPKLERVDSPNPVLFSTTSKLCN